MKEGWRSTDGEDQAGDLSTTRKARGNQTFSTWPVKTRVCSQQIEILSAMPGFSSYQ